MSNDSFSSLRRWTDEAKQAAPDAPPDLNLIRAALPKATLGPQDDHGRTLISLSISGPDGEHIRHFLPVHAAIVAALILADGRVVLRATGSWKFYPYIALPPHAPTTLSRTLFGASGKTVRERRDADHEAHRFILPSTYRLVRSLDRDMVLETVGERDGDLAALFRDLFVISDTWHGHELERVGDDE